MIVDNNDVYYERIYLMCEMIVKEIRPVTLSEAKGLARRA